MKNTFHAAEKMLLLLLCVLLTGILSACGSSKDAAQSGPAELGIYAFGTTTVSNKDRGHAFLSLKNTSDATIDFLNYPIIPGEEITIGYWPGGEATPGVAKRPKKGVYLNFDAIKDVRNQDNSHDVVSMKKSLTAEEIQKLIDFTVEFSGTKYKDLVNNCTTYAVEAWNLVNDEKPIEDTSFLNKLFDIDAPKWTKEYIQENIDGEDMSVGQYDPYDNLDDFDVFMVNSNRSLIPYYIALAEYSATVDEENTPRNIDVSWEKWAKELYDGTVPVNQVWVAYMEKGADETDFTEARIDADKGGCVLADLKMGATYVVKLCPLFEYTYKGKTDYVQGDWTELIEVKIPDDAFVQASCIGEIDGKLYALNTQYIDSSEGIQQIDLPTESDFHVTRFAYYMGRVYYAEKTPGTDGCDFRLSSCKPDGSEKKTIAEGDGLSFASRNFVIERGMLSWRMYNPNTNESHIVSYAILPGMSEAPELPLTELVLSSYQQNAAVFVKASDTTYDMYLRHQKGTDAESMGHYLVTIDDSGNTDVEYQGVCGQITWIRPDGAEDCTNPSRAFAVYDNYAYISAFENNDGVLYKLDLENPARGDRFYEIGRHMTAGGGDPFFNE